MRKLFRFFIPVLFFTFTTVSLVSGGRAQVVINEFLADPARDWDGDNEADYRDDEWVEILNLGAATVDLSVYLIADGEGEPVWRYGFAGLLEPGQVRVIYGSDSRAWEESKGYPIYGLSLNNTGDRVSLYRVSENETLVVDAFTYGDRAAYDDRSVGRSVNAPEAWAIFDAYNLCSDSCDPPGNSCIPTPGSHNECLTSAQSVNWGMIKKKYSE